MVQSCDRCESPATVHLTEIQNGEKTESHLCEECARALHVPQPSKELQKLLESFSPGAGKRAGPRNPSATCPDCGMSYAEFRQTGRFGCAKDYEVFGAELVKLLEKIHRSSTYTGKSPSGDSVEAGELIDAMSRARRRLYDAIEAEDYEQAARLRDEIRRMQSGDADAAGDASDEEGGA